MTEPIRVGVLGARGRMGQQVCQAVDAAPDLELVAMVDAGDWLFSVADAGSQVLVDFTHPDVVMDNIRFAIDQGIHAVVGTTGFTAERLETVRDVAGRRARHRRAHRAELRHRRRAVDAVRPARGAVLRVGRGHRAAPPEQGRRAERHRGAHRRADRRGPRRRPGCRRAAGRHDAEPRRLPAAPTSTACTCTRCASPGMVAHQEIVFGAEGETLTIRHDSLDRVSFMPGVLLAVRAVAARPGLTVGLESLLDL